jgi:hypothetical protein
MADKVKSGKEILDDFFNGIENIENIDCDIAKMLAKLYKEGSLTEKAVKNELDKLRAIDDSKD